MFQLVAHVLEGFYAVVPSYGLAIIAFTLTVYVVLSPLTIHQVRSMTAMQTLQPELKKLQKKHKGDREKLNAEMMALYQEHGVNPAQGCVPMLVQMPIVFVMYRVIRGLTATDSAGGFSPRYVDHGSDLFHSLHDSGGRMVSWGMDLSTSVLAPHGTVLQALPFFALAGAVVATSFWYQHLARERAAARRPDGPGQPQWMKAMPLFTLAFVLVVPTGVTLYYLASNLVRVGQQYALDRIL